MHLSDFDPFFPADKDGLFHLLSYDDLFYKYGKDEEKTSNPIAILRRHAIHLYNGGHGDVSGNMKLKNYSITMFYRDSEGNKMILTTTRLHGKVRHNLTDAMATCCIETDEVRPGLKKEAARTTPKQKEATLRIEAKVVAKRVQACQGDEEKDESIAEDASIDASAEDCGGSAADGWNEVAVTEEFM